MRPGALPSEEHRLRAPLAGDEAHGLAVDDLHPGVDTGAGAVTEAVANSLDQVAHELVVVVEPVVLDPDDGAVVADADEQVTTLGVEEISSSPASWRSWVRMGSSWPARRSRRMAPRLVCWMR